MPSLRPWLFALILLAPVAALADTPAISFTSTNGAFLDLRTRMIGWQFSLSDPVNVTSLGWYDQGGNGLNRAHEVGIWQTDTKILVAQAVVPQGLEAPLDGQFRWAGLSLPVQLQPGISYSIAGLDIGSGGDAHVWDTQIGCCTAHVSGFSVHALVQLTAGTALGGETHGFGFPTGLIGDGRAALMGPNFTVSAVPEPQTYIMMLAGLLFIGGLARSRRADPTNPVP